MFFTVVRVRIRRRLNRKRTSRITPKAIPRITMISTIRRTIVKSAFSFRVFFNGNEQFVVILAGKFVVHLMVP